MLVEPHVAAQDAENSAPTGSAPDPVTNTADGTPGTGAVLNPTTPMLRVDGIDERGNTVKYIYASDPDYVVYYSRLERVAEEHGAWRHPFSRFHRARPKAIPTGSYEREGVQA